MLQRTDERWRGADDEWTPQLPHTSIHPVQWFTSSVMCIIALEFRILNIFWIKKKILEDFNFRVTFKKKNWKNDKMIMAEICVHFPGSVESGCALVATTTS